MAKIYVALIRKHLKRMDDIPDILREQVESILNQTEGED